MSNWSKMILLLLLLVTITSSLNNPTSSKIAEKIAESASIYDEDALDVQNIKPPPFASLVMKRATWFSKNGDTETEYLLRHVGITPIKPGKDSAIPIRRRLSQDLYEDGEPRQEEQEIQGMHVLDFGYGAGHMTRLLRQSLEYKHQVHGIEISRAQSARANAATVDTGLAPGITFGTHLGFGDLPYRNNFFKHVLSQQAFSHCPDRVSTFKEIFRVLQPGGQLAFQDIFLGRSKNVMLHIEPVQKAFGSVMGTIKNYKKDLIAAGFIDIKIESIFDIAETIDVQNHLNIATKAGFFKPSQPQEQHPELLVLNVEESRLKYGDIAVANALVHNTLTFGIVKVRKPE